VTKRVSGQAARYGYGQRHSSFHRGTGSNLAGSHLLCHQLGKPHVSHCEVVSQPQGRGTAQGAEDTGESESRSVIERIGPAARQDIPNLKRCKLPVGLDGKEIHGVPLSSGMLDNGNIH
jgi:hypothetical protein